jgi:hypothetical protein
MPERSQYQFDKEAQRRVARDLLDQKAASSRPGQVYHTMTSLQDRMSRPGYTNNQADINQLKSLRRDWNRNQKYTPQGMRVSGATSPLDAQKRFMDTTATFRQANKPAYRNMYPLTGGIMHVGEKGGILGTILSEIGKMFKDRGIPTAVDDSVEEQERYVTETFGPHRENIEELDITDEYEGPWPHEGMPYLSDEAATIQKEFNTNPYFQNLKDPNVVLPFEEDLRGHPHLETYTPDAGPRLGTASPHDPTEGIRVAPWLTDPSIPMPEELVEGEYVPGQFYDELIEEEAPPPIIPFDDTGRESGIRGLHKYLKPNKYEDEFRAYIESGGDFMPYHQFERMYEEIYQGKPHALHSSYR